MEAVKQKLSDHDRHLDILSNAIEHLTETTISTNQKIDKVVDAINAQNVMRERLNNMEDNLKESFGRGHARMDSFELRIEANEALVESIPSANTIRWGVGLFLGYAVLSGNYLVSHIHQLETECKTHQEVDQIVTLDYAKRIDRLEEKEHKHDK